MAAQEKNPEMIVIGGNRPEIIKLALLVKQLKEKFRCEFVYTGQHYSSNMKEVFQKEFDFEFDHDLKCGTSEVPVLRESIRNFLKKVTPKFVLVYGDTASTMAGALAAKDVGCKLVHVEAGLRNFNLSYIEEKTRVTVDAMSDYFLVPTELHKLFLKYEQKEDRVYVTGNLIVDICRKFAKEASKEATKIKDNYILLTLHKPASIDSETSLKRLTKFLPNIDHEIVWPVHPRTIKNIAKYGIKFPKNITMIDAVGYKEFLSLLQNCTLVLTDSGGVQEEAAILGKPCITLFSTTDRQETILVGANRLYYPYDQETPINQVIQEMLSAKITRNPYGENVTKRALEAIEMIVSSP